MCLHVALEKRRSGSLSGMVKITVSRGGAAETPKCLDELLNKQNSASGCSRGNSELSREDAWETTNLLDELLNKRDGASAWGLEKVERPQRHMHQIKWRVREGLWKVRGE